MKLQRKAVIPMHIMTACREMEDYFHSFLIPTLHRRCYLISLTSQFTRREEATDPSKYEAKIAHIEEGLGLFVFDVWTAAYEISTFFRNVRIRHQLTSQKEEWSATLLWKNLLLIGTRNENTRISITYLSIRIG